MRVPIGCLNSGGFDSVVWSGSGRTFRWLGLLVRYTEVLNDTSQSFLGVREYVGQLPIASG